MRPHALAAPLVLALAAPAAAQDDPFVKMGDLTSATGIGQAAEKIRNTAKDGMLVADLLGKELTGHDGHVLGTVKDFVVVPGGRLIAAVVETDDGQRIAVPFAAIKLEGLRGQRLPVTAEELKSMTELSELGKAIDAGELTN